MGKLSQQIAKAMAALTQTKKGSAPSSPPDVPWGPCCRLGHSSRSTPSHPNSHNGRGGHGQTTLACSIPTEQGVDCTGGQGSDQSNPGLSVRVRVQLLTETHILSSV